MAARTTRAELNQVRRAWYLNLDADMELASVGPYQSPRALLAQAAARADRGEALTQGETCLDLPTPAPFEHAQADVAIPWCPTQNALTELLRAGWPVPACPAHDVLRQVNDRRFVLDLGDPALERRWIADVAEAGWLEPGVRWRLKRPFGFAGRGQRVLGAQRSADDERWLVAAKKTGLVRERDVTIDAEWSQHGYVDRGGLALGTPLRQFSDRFGSVVRLEPASPDFEFTTALKEAAEEVAERLLASGYHGPFGIDAFLFRLDGERRFNALSELNARFTLGWSLGMGQQREGLLARLCRSGVTCP